MTPRMIIKQVAIMLVVITAGVLICLGSGWIAIGIGRGLASTWHNITTVSPEERQAAEAAEAAWATSPENPKVIAQKCLDRGGIPTFSAWDGRVTSCQGGDPSKSVNIEVNQ